MSKHKPECRDKQCLGCGQESELAVLKERVKELEKHLLLIGDKAVTDWDDATVGQVDAVVSKVPVTYAEWARDILDCARKYKAQKK
jgi:hypothetical protein